MLTHNVDGVWSKLWVRLHCREHFHYFILRHLHKWLLRSGHSVCVSKRSIDLLFQALPCVDIHTSHTETHNAYTTGAAKCVAKSSIKLPSCFCNEVWLCLCEVQSETTLILGQGQIFILLPYPSNSTMHHGILYYLCAQTIFFTLEKEGDRERDNSTVISCLKFWLLCTSI